MTLIFNLACAWDVFCGPCFGLGGLATPAVKRLRRDFQVGEAAWA